MQKRPLILVVDDDPTLRMLLEFILRRQYRVVMREDGLDAMRWMTAGNLPDVILADYEMPHLNGLGLLQQVKASGLLGGIPVLILTGHESQELTRTCMAAGAFAYLLKPFNPDQVLARIASALSLSVAA
ncbi:MAG: response regulator [Bacteroidia bacterium]|nr:response regulator [Bacteroidia bacterium]